MSITVIGGSPPAIHRVSTNIYSLDKALSHFGQVGLPLRSGIEIYGDPHVGKSSLAYYLSGRINPQGEVVVCDLEGLDRDYLLSSITTGGFDGTVHFVPAIDDKGRYIQHVAMTRYAVDQLQTKETVSSVILDSIGAYIPIAEDNAEAGDVVMGRRAIEIAQWTRRITRVTNTRNVPSCYFIINHVHAVIGGRGHETSGGDTPKFLVAVRMFLWQKEAIKSSDEISAYVVGGAIEKLRYGGKGRKFQFCLIQGFGISPLMSAVMDCVELKLATRSTTVKIGDKSVGYLNTLIEYARDNKANKFEPFFTALEEQKRKDEGIHVSGTSMEESQE